MEQSANAGPVFLSNTESFTTKILGNSRYWRVFFLLTKLLPMSGRFFRFLESSLAQGRRTRAGGSLESHLEFLLKKSGFQLGTEFGTQVEIGGRNKVRLDLLFPADPTQLDMNPNVVVTCACMTTVNDRVRLAIQQLQPNTFRRVPTAHGAIQFDGQIKNLKGRLDYATSNGFRFVVLPEVISHLSITPL